MTHSFDIFDTCLVRLCGTPSSFFDVLSNLVFTTEVDEMTRQEFVVQRKQAERSLCDKPETNIFDIYRAFSYKHPALLSVEDLAETELSLEREMLVPVLSIRKEIEGLHNKGESVLFISDMYIPGVVIVEILKKNGLYADGDKVYVSCDYGARKYDGELYKLIKRIEGISYRQWIHKGDNVNGDFNQPKKLGIRTELINHEYTPIQKLWLDKSIPTRYYYSGILAGLSRAVGVYKEYTDRRDFILDLIAPLYCSFVYKVLSGATEKGIRRVFFCARDTYQLYRLALIMQPMFPHLEIKYLRISRTALYEGNADLRMRYYIQEGLASRTDQSAIVDSTSSGKTVKTINEELNAQGYLPLCAYYLLKWDDQHIDMSGITFDAPIRQFYVDEGRGAYITPMSVLILENFFSTNGDARTIDYVLGENGEVLPIFSGKQDIQDAIQEDVLKWQEYEADLLSDYSRKMDLLGLYKYADQILELLAIPTLLGFWVYPYRFYLKALTGYQVYVKDLGFVPYIRKESILRLFKTRGLDSGWKHGTVIYNLPQWLIKCRWKK